MKLTVALFGLAAFTGVAQAAFTPFATGFEASDGYGAPGETAIGVKDVTLAANQDGDPNNDVAWVNTGTESDPATLAVTGTGYDGSAQGLFLTDGSATALPSASLDLTGQDIPTDSAWSFELAFLFDSSSRNTQDEVHVELGGAAGDPLIHFALRRAGGNTAYQFDFLFETPDGLEVVMPGAFETGEYVHTRVEVTPAGVAGDADGRLRLWVNGVEQTLGNDSLPSLTATPSTLHVYTSESATGLARIDALAIVPEPASASLMVLTGLAALLHRHR